MGSSCSFSSLVLLFSRPAFYHDGWAVDFIVVGVGYLRLCFTMGNRFLLNSLTLA